MVLRDLSDALGHYFLGDALGRSRRTQSLRSSIAESLVNDASLLPAAIAQVYQSNSDNNRRKNVHFINIITHNIISYCNGLEHDGIKEKEYVQLLRGELKTFRKSFKKWRKSIFNNFNEI